jgi:hypothetical protein
MKKGITTILLTIFVFSGVIIAQKRWGFYAGMNFSQAPIYGNSYLQKANTEFKNLDELEPYFGVPKSDKGFMHKHLALWRVIKNLRKMSYKAEVGVISFGYKEERDMPTSFAAYPFYPLPLGPTRLEYTFYSHYMYVGPVAGYRFTNKLEGELGFLYWFQSDGFVNLTSNFTSEAYVQKTDGSSSGIKFTNIRNPDSRSGGLMSRIGLSYNFEPSLRLHLLYNQFITPANKRTEWGRIYHRSLGIGLSYEFGKKIKNTK